MTHLFISLDGAQMHLVISSYPKYLNAVLTIQDFEFGTLPWHLVIRVKFGTCVENWDFIGTKIWDFNRL